MRTDRDIYQLCEDIINTIKINIVRKSISLSSPMSVTIFIAVVDNWSKQFKRLQRKAARLPDVNQYKN